MYLAHLNPENDALFQRPKESSDKFSSDTCTVWFSARKLGHNTLENMLKIMTTRAEIYPYLTNHSLRATTVTVLSSNNIETRKIKAVTGHRSDTSVESYCERPTLDQFKDMSNALSSYIDHETSEISPIPQSQLGNASHPSTSLPRAQTGLLPSSRSSSGQRYFSSQQENFLIECGCNLEAIRPSGTFENCSFTFNINSNHWRVFICICKLSKPFVISLFVHQNGKYVVMSVELFKIKLHMIVCAYIMRTAFFMNLIKRFLKNWDVLYYL